MRILQLLGHGGVGGTETFAIALVRGLGERGHDATLVNTWTDSPLNAVAAQAGIPFVALPGGGRRVGLRWFRVVYRYLRDNAFDLIQVYGLRMSVGLRFMQRRLGIRHHLMGVRGLDQQRTGLQAILDRRTEDRVDRIVCNAHAVARRRMAVVGTPASRIVVIPNGIDVGAFQALPPGPTRSALGLSTEFLFVCVASFRPEKDHVTLLEALQLAGPALKRAQFAFIGGGRGREAVESEVLRRGLGARIVFTGPVADVRPYLHTADAFVLSSYSEGMPRAVMEAMAVGLPVVSTRAGGVEEVAEDERHALLVPTRDPAGLAAALVRIRGDADLRARLGEAAAQRIRADFTLERMLDRHVRLYESLLESDGP